jgi:hypothetical protein
VLIRRLRPVKQASRAGVLVASLAACGALLAGCGAGPSQTGAAAVVGDQTVSLSDTQKQIDRALAQPGLVDGATPAVVASLAAQDHDNPRYQNLSPEQQRAVTQALFGRVILTREVQHMLLVEAARRNNLVVSDRQVDAVLARPGVAKAVGAAGLAFDPASVREAMRDRLTSQALAAKYVDRLSIVVDVIGASSRGAALTAARGLAAGGDAAEDAIKKAGQNGHANLRLRAAQVAKSDSVFLFGTPAGQVVAAYTGGDSWTVWRVTQRTIAPPPPGAVSLATVLDPSALQTIGVQLLQPLAEELNVRVNPRYGTWDAPNVMVLGPDQPASVVLPASLS